MQTGDRPISVVLVDDHDLVLRMMVTMLGIEPGVEVAGTATNLLDALRVVGDVKPDVLVLDYNLPDGDGVAGTSRILRVSPATKVVLFTGWDDPRTRAAALEAGCVAVVAKGVMLDVLAGVIRAAAGTA